MVNFQIGTMAQLLFPVKKPNSWIWLSNYKKYLDKHLFVFTRKIF